MGMGRRLPHSHYQMIAGSILGSSATPCQPITGKVWAIIRIMGKGCEIQCNVSLISDVAHSDAEAQP